MSGDRPAAPAVLHDVLRLFLAATDRTPRGIDRIDLAYARFLCTDWPGPSYGLLPTPLGPRLFDRARVLRGLDELERLWQEDASAATDPVFAYVQARLAGQDGAPPPPAPPMHRRAKLARLRRLIAATGLAAGAGAVARAPLGAVYLNVGQLGWAAPFTTRWLRRRPDIRPVFMLHDAIPVERRDLVSGPGHWTHRMMLHSVARRASGLIVTTDSAAASVRTALAARGRGALPTAGIPLPVAPLFLAPAAPDPHLAAHRYFLVCGAIEPRKNLPMLLDVWQAMERRLGEATPHLVVAGALARRGAPILQRLQAAGRRVTVVANLSSPALRLLMAQARALLMPSLAEGFGLPIIEALALGTPVLASDLPAHREAGGAFPVYLDPQDTTAWTDAITALAGADGAALAAARQRVAGYRPFTQADYFRRAGAFLTELAARPA